MVHPQGSSPYEASQTTEILLILGQKITPAIYLLFCLIFTSYGILIYSSSDDYSKTICMLKSMELL